MHQHIQSRTVQFIYELREIHGVSFVKVALLCIHPIFLAPVEHQKNRKLQKFTGLCRIVLQVIRTISCQATLQTFMAAAMVFIYLYSTCETLSTASQNLMFHTAVQFECL